MDRQYRNIMNKDSLEYKLDFKLRSGQITQEEYENLHEKFMKLGMLSSPVKIEHVKVDLEGSRSVEGIVIDGPVTLSGGVTVNGPVECTSLSTSGSVNIIGNLLVLGKSSISGELNVEEEVKFGGKSTITGTLRINDNLLSTQKMSVSGNLISNAATFGDKLHIVGKLQSGSIRSSSSVKVNGVILIDNIIADEFDFSTTHAKSENSTVEDNIVANKIRISSPLTTIKIDLGDKLSNLKLKLPGKGILSSLINERVSEFIPEVMKGINNLTEEISAGLANFGDFQEQGLVIRGNVEGKDIFLSHVLIQGDVVGETIMLGPKVTINGKIKYSSSFSSADEDTEYDLEKN